jgi:hypothetical protein
MIDFIETNVEFILELLHVPFPLDKLLCKQYANSLHDEIPENNGSGRNMGNRIGRDTVSSQLV